MAKKIDEPEEGNSSLAVNDAWTGMLVVSFLALSVGTGFLAWDYFQYSDQSPPPAPKYNSTLPGGPVKKDPVKEPPKDEVKDGEKDKDAKEKDAKDKDAKDAKEKDAMPKDAKEKDAMEKDAKEKDAKEKDAKEKDAKEKDASLGVLMNRWHVCSISEIGQEAWRLLVTEPRGLRPACYALTKRDESDLV